MKFFMSWCDRQFNQNKLVRRLIVVWAGWLITTVTLKVFSDLTLINSAVVSGFGLVVGILATVLAFYINARIKEDSE